MPKDLKLRIQRAVITGPDMRKPQYPGGYEPPAAGVADARFIGYFELGEHECIRDGLSVFRERVRLMFELSGKDHPGRLVDGVRVPHVISVETDLDLSPGARFFDTFSRMNFENAASHMAELLGDAFIVSVGHGNFKNRPGVYATVDAHKGYMIYPAKIRDEAAGKIINIPITPATYRCEMFMWLSADLDDWYALHIPGEWPEQKDPRTGEISKPARSKNFLQERIMAARNWPHHPLAAVAMLGPDPKAPTAEELEQQRDAELKERRKGYMKMLNAAVNRAMLEHAKVSTQRRPRTARKRPPA